MCPAANQIKSSVRLSYMHQTTWHSAYGNNCNPFSRHLVVLHSVRPPVGIVVKLFSNVRLTVQNPIPHTINYYSAYTDPLPRFSTLKPPTARPPFRSLSLGLSCSIRKNRPVGAEALTTRFTTVSITSKQITSLTAN